jgi:hypothetical protein
MGDIERAIVRAADTLCVRLALAFAGMMWV